MKLKVLSLVFFSAFLIFNISWAMSKEAPKNSSLTLEKILDNLENSYASTGFSAKFVQTSTIKAMDVSDTASGKIFVKPPGMMRWEYESPDPQLIISDGKNLWIYKPVDNQVMVGKSPDFFGDGKGAVFLSNIKVLRKKFSISLEKPEDDDLYLLKLIPQKNTLDLSKIYIFISKQDFNLVRIITHNTFGDETRIDMNDINFDSDLNSNLFTFAAPKGADVVQMAGEEKNYERKN